MKRQVLLLLNQQNPIRFLIAYFLFKTSLCKFITFKANNILYKFNKSNLLMQLFTSRSISNFENQFIENFLSEGDVFVDIGANIGTWSLNASRRVGNFGRVFSIEPHPITYDWLLQNISLNKMHNIITYNLGIGHMKDDLKFTNSLDDQNHIMVNNNETDTIYIPVNKLDNLKELKKIKSIRLLKIDIEGFEFYALQGAKETLKKTELIIFESFEEFQNLYKYTTSDLLSFIRSCGFQILRIDEKGILTKIEDTDYSSLVIENLIAIQNSIYNKR